MLSLLLFTLLMKQNITQVLLACKRFFENINFTCFAIVYLILYLCQIIIADLQLTAFYACCYKQFI